MHALNMEENRKYYTIPRCAHRGEKRHTVRHFAPEVDMIYQYATRSNHCDMNNHGSTKIRHS